MVFTVVLFQLIIRFFHQHAIVPSLHQQYRPRSKIDVSERTARKVFLHLAVQSPAEANERT
jgi:hypothetical protein